MTDHSIAWRIETPDAGTLTAEALVGDIPEYRRGATRSYTLGFAETGAGRSDYRALRQHLDYAGAVTTGASVTGVPWYREQLPGRAAVTEQLVAVVPSRALRSRFEVRGVWGVIVDGSDETLPTVTARALDLELYVLAEYVEYDSRADAREAFAT
jgi:hypothetical protein